jgi:uncharacterized membrane protein
MTGVVTAGCLMADKHRFPISLDCSSARLALVSLWAALAVTVVAAPLLASHSHSLLAAALYLLLSPACHQDPARSFFLAGYPLAVCHRCSGIYFGLLVSAVFAPRVPSALVSCSQRRIRVALGTLPLLIDALLPLTGIWTNTPWSRFVTGFAFGATLSSLLVPGVSELFSRSPRRLLRVHVHHLHGDLV